MKYLRPYRLASYLLVLFAIGHTAGGLFGKHDYGAEAEAVWSGMQSVTFNAMGSPSTWYGFWMGFGLLVTVFLLMSSAIAFQLGGMERAARRAVAPIGWTLLVAAAANAFLSWRYFFLPPAIMATLVTALIGFECVRDAVRGGDA